MNESSIKHPPRATFVQMHAWVVRVVGRDAAAVLGQLDFLDRAQPATGLVVATRQRLLADLEGLVTKYGLDKSLPLLVEKGWIFCKETEEVRGRNLTKIHEYGLNVSKINEYLV